MPPIIDIAVCLEFTSSIVSYYNPIRQMILNIYAKAFINSQGHVRLGLIKFGLNADACNLYIHGFAPNRDTLEQWLDMGTPFGGRQDEHEAVGKKKQISTRI
jgi:hypothetical protein